jgi:hypothetical protein
MTMKKHKVAIFHFHHSQKTRNRVERVAKTIGCHTVVGYNGSLL